MRLHEYLEVQHRFQLVVMRRRYQIENLSALTDVQRNAVFKDHVLAITDELHEILRELNWKMHANEHEIDWENVREEVIDVAKYTFNLILYAGMDECTFDELFKEKSRIVSMRFDKDTTVTEGTDG